MGQARGQRHQGFASACGAGQRHKVHFRVGQQVHGEVLFAVAGGHTPDRVFQVVEVAQGFEHCGISPDFCHARIQAGLTRRLKVHKLVDQHAGHSGAIDLVKGVLSLLPAFNALAVGGPKVGGQRHRARIQQIAVFQGFVVLVVVGGQAQGTGLDAHIDVFGHQHHFAGWIFFAQRLHYAQDLVVRLALGQAGGQTVVQRLGLEQQFALGLALASAAQIEALGNVRTGRAGQRVERAAGLAGVARHFGHAFFVTIELFEHDHGQEDVVFFKAEHAHRVVHQHIGVKHKQLGRTAAGRFAAARGYSLGYRLGCQGSGASGGGYRDHRCHWNGRLRWRSTPGFHLNCRLGGRCFTQERGLAAHCGALFHVGADVCGRVWRLGARRSGCGALRLAPGFGGSVKSRRCQSVSTFGRRGGQGHGLELVKNRSETDKATGNKKRPPCYKAAFGGRGSVKFSSMQTLCMSQMSPPCARHAPNGGIRRSR